MLFPYYQTRGQNNTLTVRNSLMFQGSSQPGTDTFSSPLLEGYLLGPLWARTLFLNSVHEHCFYMKKNDL